MTTRAMRRGAAALVTVAAAMLGGLTVTSVAQAAPGGQAGAAAAQAAHGSAAQPGAVPQIAGVCGSHWGNSFPPPTVRRGSVDTTDPSAVKLAQCYLNLSILDSNLAIDGIFGPATEAMVRRFQAPSCGNAPPVDGIVGPVTWNRLRAVANSPDFAC